PDVAAGAFGEQLGRGRDPLGIIGSGKPRPSSIGQRFGDLENQRDRKDFGSLAGVVRKKSRVTPMVACMNAGEIAVEVVSRLAAWHRPDLGPKRKSVSHAPQYSGRSTTPKLRQTAQVGHVGVGCQGFGAKNRRLDR